MNRIIFILATVLCLVATTVHSDDQRDRASITQLRTLGTLVTSFVSSHNGQFPKTLDELIASQKSPDPTLLISPLATDKNKPSYELTRPAERLNQVVDPARTVLIRSRYALSNGRVPVLFVDGHVEALKPAP